ADGGRTMTGDPDLQAPAGTGGRVRRGRGRILAVAILVVVAAAGGSLYWIRRANGRKAAAIRHAARGGERRAGGERAAAVREFRAATELHPGSAQAWYMLAETQHELDPKQGLPALKRAVELAPENPLYAREYGIALRQIGKLDEARPVLQRAVQLA